MNSHHGFTTELQNGLTVSVQWHDLASAMRDEDDKLITVEIACWKTDQTRTYSIEVEDANWTDEIKDAFRARAWLTQDVWPEDGYSEDMLTYVPVVRIMDMIDSATQLPNNYVNLLHTQRAKNQVVRKINELKQEAVELAEEYDVALSSLDYGTPD